SLYSAENVRRFGFGAGSSPAGIGVVLAMLKGPPVSPIQTNPINRVSQPRLSEREKASPEPSTGKRTREKKDTSPQSDMAAKNSAPKKPARKAADAKAPQPTLVELVRYHLAEQGDPRSAAEVATALDTAHPERGIKTTVVRTTLENLVAKNQAQRTKQGRSVYYTASNAAEQTATPAQAEPAKSEQVA
ncbi:BlaI/MecI/CopY family transcriptional regulator, partial [Streptomyces sp. NPDC002547]